MTTADIAAGRELDALVAEKVMGWEWLTFNRTSYIVRPEWASDFLRPGLSWQAGALGEKDIDWLRMPSYRDLAAPKFSTDIAAAFEVVERLHHIHGGCAIDIFYGKSITPWTVRVISGNDDRQWKVDDDALPRAICRAALAATEAATT